MFLGPFETKDFYFSSFKYGGLALDWQAESYFFRSEVGNSYQCLWRKEDGFLVMSDTETEEESHRHATAMARGDVLVFGIGIGRLNHYLYESPNINSVTVLEKHQELVDQIGVSIQHDKLSMIHTVDMFDFELVRKLLGNTKYDFIWEDISEPTHEYNWQQFYAEFLKLNGEIAQWGNVSMASGFNNAELKTLRPYYRPKLKTTWEMIDDDSEKEEYYIKYLHNNSTLKLNSSAMEVLDICSNGDEVKTLMKRLIQKHLPKDNNIFCQQVKDVLIDLYQRGLIGFEGSEEGNNYERIVESLAE